MNSSDSRREKIEALLRIYSRGKISQEEEQELFDLIDIVKDEDIIRKHIENIVLEQATEQNVPAVNWEMLYRKIEERKRAISPDSKIRKMFLAKWRVAAAAVLLLGTGYYFVFIQKQGGQVEVVKTESQKVVDIAPPVSTNAVLTLANGQVVVLDSAGNGTIVQQGAVDVVKLADGQIAYKGAGQDTGHNTLSNPRGSRIISLMLADGTRVWLNAASSIRYPVAFIGEERRVELEGEAYFEVAKNEHMPFYVGVGTMSVKVLGTHFDVSAYADENNIRTTLVEGSVVVNSGSEVITLKRGQQAKLDKKDDALKKVDNVDIGAVTAWKNNEFFFNETELRDAMKQLSRWYDFEVVYENQIPPTYLYGTIQRDKTLTDVLKIMEASGLKFRIEKEEATNKLVVLK